MTMYDELAQMATDMLAPVSEDGFGKTTAYIRTTTTVAYNPATGSVTDDTTVDVAVNAVQVGYNEYHAPGAMIEQGDLFFALDGQPTIYDELLINGYLYDVVQIWPIMPGATFIACRVQTRIGLVATQNVVNVGVLVVNNSIQVVNT